LAAAGKKIGEKYPEYEWELENLPDSSVTGDLEKMLRHVSKSAGNDEPNGIVSLVYIDLDSLKMNHDETPVKKTLTIPSWLNKAAEQKNIDFSSTLKDALLEKLAH
jgi:hypothetical protein